MSFHLKDPAGKAVDGTTHPTNETQIPSKVGAHPSDETQTVSKVDTHPSGEALVVDSDHSDEESEVDADRRDEAPEVDTDRSDEVQLVSEVNTIKSPGDLLKHWVKNLFLWTMALYSPSVTKLLKSNMVQISYVPTLPPLQPGSQAPLADTLREINELTTTRERVATSYASWPSKRRIPQGVSTALIEGLLNILVGEGEKAEGGKQWCDLFAGRVHCESELTWRMDDRSTTNHIQV